MEAWGGQPLPQYLWGDAVATTLQASQAPTLGSPAPSGSNVCSGPERRHSTSQMHVRGRISGAQPCGSGYRHHPVLRMCKLAETSPRR